MKQFVSLVFVSLCLFTPTPETVLAEESSQQITVLVKGMVCSFCAQGIKKTFSKRTGVEEIKVDLEKKVVSLKVNKNENTLPDAEIKELINDAGYEVLSINRK